VGSKKYPQITVNQRKDKNEYQRQYRELSGKVYPRDHEKTREAAWKRRYGITREDYNRMFSDQNGSCKICKTTEIGRGHTHFHVDHNHTTGKIRGLLCDKCNRGLGYFDDRYDLLKDASSYLQEHLEV
jgi:hypothetical protein